MNTPSITLPHVSVPDVPRVDVGDVADRAGDLWSSNVDRITDLAADLASAARDRAGDLAAVAADLLDDVPDKAMSIAAVAIPTLRPTPKRSKKPFVLLAVVLAVVAGGLWFRRRRATSETIAPVGSADAAGAFTSAAS